MKKKKTPEIARTDVIVPKGFEPKYFEIVNGILEIYWVKTKKLKPYKFVL